MEIEIEIEVEMEVEMEIEVEMEMEVEMDQWPWESPATHFLVQVIIIKPGWEGTASTHS